MSLSVCPPIPAMTTEAIEKVRALESHLLELHQVDIPTHHLIHGGLYARTITIPAGVVITGCLIKIPTVLIINGDASVFLGDKEIRVQGYLVVPASEGRKQAFIAHADTQLTMLFPTQAKTVEQAEEEFTDESELLGSRHCENFITITGD